MKLKKEVSIERIIRQLRVLRADAREKYSKEDWRKMRRNHMVRVHDDYDSNFSNPSAPTPQHVD